MHHVFRKLCSSLIWQDLVLHTAVIPSLLFFTWTHSNNPLKMGKIKISLRTYQQHLLPCGEAASETVHASSDSFSRAATVPSLIWAWLTEDQTWLRTNHGTVLVQKTTPLSLLLHHILITTSFPCPVSQHPVQFSALSVFRCFQTSLTSRPLCVAYPLTASFHTVTSLLSLTYFKSTLLTFTTGPSHHEKHRRQAFMWTFPTPRPSLLLKVYHRLLMAPTALGLHRREHHLPSQPLASLQKPLFQSNNPGTALPAKYFKALLTSTACLNLFSSFSLCSSPLQANISPL